jgi:hypothetical protein
MAGKIKKKKPYRSPSQPEGQPYKAGQNWDRPKGMSDDEYDKVVSNDSKLYQREWSKKHKRPIVRVKHSTDLSVKGHGDIRRTTSGGKLSVGKRDLTPEELKKFNKKHDDSVWMAKQGHPKNSNAKEIRRDSYYDEKGRPVPDPQGRDYIKKAKKVYMKSKIDAGGKLGTLRKKSEGRTPKRVDGDYGGGDYPRRYWRKREQRSGARFVEKVRKAEKTNPELFKQEQERVNAPNYKTNSSAKPKHRATISYLKQGGGYKIKKRKKLFSRKK